MWLSKKLLPLPSFHNTRGNIYIYIGFWGRKVANSSMLNMLNISTGIIPEQRYPVSKNKMKKIS